MTRIVVVGSINMDPVTQTPRFVGPGETILAIVFSLCPAARARINR